jgi:hypothetical protein
LYDFSPTTPYSPAEITPAELLKAQADIRSEILDARVAIAQLAGFIKGVPSSTQALLSPIYLKEALASSEIENIITPLIEVMQRLIAPSPKQDDSTLVVNYFTATLSGARYSPGRLELAPNLRPARPLATGRRRNSVRGM